VNIARDVRWGRTEETYGEDPYLSSRMGVAFVSEFETRGVITTPKHFVANVGAGGRDSYPIHFNERLMEEIYFPAFKSCFTEGGSRSVMTSYNSYDGTPCTANSWILHDKLKKEWGFNGFVISDAGATGGANVLHFTAEDYPGSTTNAINGGLDVIFQTSFDHYPLFFPAFTDGSIDMAYIDEAVRRVLRAKFELGLFENPYVDPAEAVKKNASEDNMQTALQAARESIVLLKNNGILPLKNRDGKIAIIGEDAIEARLGGYSGPGSKNRTILDAIKESGTLYHVNYEKGPGRTNPKHLVIPPEQLFMPESDENGLKGEYFDNNKLEGEPVLERKDNTINFGWTLFSPDPSLAYDWYSVRWTGRLRSKETGSFDIGLEGNDGYRLYIDGKLIIDNWEKRSFSKTTSDFAFEKGREYEVKVEFFESTGNSRIKLIWNQGLVNKAATEINRAVKLASESDVAVVVAGIDEGEFQDRASLALPGLQEELISRVAATGTPVVVVLVGGSAITMSSWHTMVDAIVNVWYPGDMGGDAVAEVLNGHYNPAGRLPITYPVDEAQLPLYYNHKPTGRGDDYMNLTGHPLFPFGYGLSYTSFEYSDLKLSSTRVKKGEKLELSLTLSNTGNFDGDEVVQLYLRDEIASVARPVMELKRFKRIHIKKGESARVTFELKYDDLAMLNDKMERVVEPGKFRIMIGSSSRDIRLRTHFNAN
ncbi:MAG: glycoside hydrolase family 3 C-terminal domain-containing protein, partial [Eudoraea sp.]|nr:glycoside hydrolase family 3 C-terminal domain-containing protein [Eudoraea sp.]